MREEEAPKRDYRAMRNIIRAVARANGPVEYAALKSCAEPASIPYEVERLEADGLIDGDMRFDVFGEYVSGRIERLTDEGRAFLNLIAKKDTWETICETLDAAGINVPYPLLKEVCEEIVKRYVISFIPAIGSRGKPEAPIA